MSEWRCRFCGKHNERATGVCECKTPMGGQCPGDLRERPALPSYAYVPTKGQVKKLHKESPDLDVRTAEEILKDIREERASVNAPRPKLRWVPEDQRHMLELDVFDLHVGKLAWALETGENYDAGIATERAEAAVEDLLQQAQCYAVEKILLPLGNDFLHYDTLSGTTTAGTPQDRDSRYQLMYRRAFTLARRMAERCALIAPVHLLIVPGNHDTLSTFTLGVALEAYFHADPRITVENTPKPRKYVRYGVNLIGFAHGHNEPHKRLPGLMPVEVPDDWALTRYREFHVGHFHKSKVTDPVRVDGENGVRVRVLQSLTGTDAWHAAMGYVGEHAAAEAFVWSHARGLRANLISTVWRDAAA